jgi:hypothetical protein
MTRPDKAEEARQWDITRRLVGVALGLACVVVLTLARRYL